MTSAIYVWEKSVRADHADLWTERLCAAVAPGRLAVTTRAAARNVRLEVYCNTDAEADELAERFGGRVREVAPESWQPTSTAAPGRPLRIGGRLWVTGHPDELPTWLSAHPAKPVLCIPAAMAFGTGEHATTAMCLRLLAETVRARAFAGPWDFLDLGTGSGILALAATQLGARTSLGLDNDPHAVRTARGNAALNSLPAVRFQRADLLDAWQPEPGRWRVIAANLFSELLTTLLPRIRVALAPGGLLIASGVLVSQAPELTDRLRQGGFHLLATRRRGKWTAFLVTRP